MNNWSENIISEEYHNASNDIVEFSKSELNNQIKEINWITESFDIPDLLVSKAEEFIKEILSELKDQWFLFHNLEHTLWVVKRAKYLAKKEWLNENCIKLLIIAWLFHDTWYWEHNKKTKNNLKHEEEWVEIFKKFLKENNFDQIDEKIKEIIYDIILSTKINKKPNNILECIIKDSDLDNLWREDFKEKSLKLLEEINLLNQTNTEESKWYKQTYRLFKNYTFYSPTQRKERLAKWEENKDRLSKI